MTSTMFLKIAIKSLLNRKGSVIMSLLAISVAIFVLLGIEHIRQQARDSFASTVSGVDLIVGAKDWESQPAALFGVSRRHTYRQH